MPSRTTSSVAVDVAGLVGPSVSAPLAFGRDGRALALFQAFVQQRRRQRFTAVAAPGSGRGCTCRGDVAGIGWGSAQTFLHARTRVTAPAPPRPPNRREVSP